MKKMNHVGIGLLFSVVTLTGCGGGGGGGGGAGAIDPGAEPNAVMETILIKVGDRDARLRDGSPPAPTSSGNDPVLRAATNEVAVPSGGSASLVLDFEVSSAVSAIFAKVVGADRFAEVLLGSETQSRAGTKAMENVVLDIAVPSNIGAGQFCVQISGRDADSLVSNVDTVCFNVDDAIIDALQGNWDFACSPAADGSESFEGLWAIDGTDVNVTEVAWDNGSCSGVARGTNTEQVTLAIGAQVQAADGEPANVIDLRNLTENDRFFTLIRVDGDRFQLALAPNGSGDSPEMRASSFERNVSFTRRDTSVSSARACFNPVLYEEGTEVVRTVRYEGRNDGEFGGTPGELEVSEEYTETVFTEGQTTFDGRPAIQMRTPNTRDSGQGEQVDIFRYVQIDRNRPSVTFLGDEVVAPEGSSGSERETLNPGYVQPYDLNEGESVQQTVVIEENDIEDNDSGTVRVTTTYVGRETVDIDNRRIETCRFDVDIVYLDTDQERDPYVSHYSVESGLEVLFYEIDPDTGVRTDQDELIAATVNGVSVDD